MALRPPRVRPPVPERPVVPEPVIPDAAPRAVPDEIPLVEAPRVDAEGLPPSAVPETPTAEVPPGIIPEPVIPPVVAPAPVERSILDSAPPWGDGAEGVPESLSAAAVSPGIAPSANAGLLDRESLVATGVGLEKFAWNLVLRLKQSSSLYGRQVVESLVDLGGMKTNKNLPDPSGMFPVEPNRTSVETRMATNHTPVLIETLQEIRMQWLLSRGENAKTYQESITDQPVKSMRIWATDKVGMTQGMGFAAFEERVGRAGARNDIDPVRDHYTPFVEAAAQAQRKALDHLKQHASDVNLFEKSYRESLTKAKKELAAVKADPRRASELADAQFRVDQARKHLELLRRHGPQVNTAPSFMPRIPLVEELMARKDDFVRIASDWLRTSRGMQPGEASIAAEKIHDLWAKTGARPDLSQINQMFDEVLNPASAMARTFEIPDELVESFLERNSGVILRHHFRTMSPDIELMREFRSTNLEPQIDIIRKDYQQLIDATRDPVERQRLAKQRERDVEDIYAARDKLRGTYGASKDPHNMTSRTIRLLKNYTTWTMMGMSAFSQMGDLFRPAITEGLDALFRHGFGTLLDQSRPLIMKMARDERILAGDGIELVSASYGFSLSDLGDVHANRSRMERQANQYTGLFYMMNGMNLATDITKDWGSTIWQGKHNDLFVRAWQRKISGTGRNLTEEETSRLAQLGLPPDMVDRIGEMIETHGPVFRSIQLAGTADWTDKAAQAAYRNAHLQGLRRTILTKGVADTPNWMSTELGSLVMQFRSFGVSSAIRTTYAGLQERGYNFWVGAAVLTGSAMVMNEIRKQLFYDKSSLEQGYLGALIDGLDRSGVLGGFFDINNAMEVFSNGEIGMRPLVGAGHKYNPTSRVMSVLGGPVAGQAAAAVDIVGDVVSGNPTARTWRQMRNFVPGQNLPYVDPFADAMFPTGRGRVGRASQQEGATPPPKDNRPARARKEKPVPEPAYDPVEHARRFNEERGM